ncbi:hypothetical protein THAOC_27012 [Thalassiosira oceanica]|uniref:Uncharacterized protein n=1 Tax=Thalassiosira oceanica TaxID=159749 RepID=K0RXF7_THAOC|nr:hypothetical protein THAOC_27012 [Thalassiosira oceanica]|eukprot:EJK53536.1 hypothetical protein THAOC_27012 [Thalassiosira oceanica]
MLSRATRAGSVGVSNSTPASLLGLGASRNSSSETLASRGDLRPKGGGSSGADGSSIPDRSLYFSAQLKLLRNNPRSSVKSIKSSQV